MSLLVGDRKQRGMAALKKKKPLPTALNGAGSASRNTSVRVGDRKSGAMAALKKKQPLPATHQSSPPRGDLASSSGSTAAVSSLAMAVEADLASAAGKGKAPLPEVTRSTAKTADKEVEEEEITFV